MLFFSNANYMREAIQIELKIPEEEAGYVSQGFPTGA